MGSSSSGLGLGYLAMRMTEMPSKILELPTGLFGYAGARTEELRTAPRRTRRPPLPSKAGGTEGEVATQVRDAIASELPRDGPCCFAARFWQGRCRPNF